MNDKLFHIKIADKLCKRFYLYSSSLIVYCLFMLAFFSSCTTTKKTVVSEKPADPYQREVFGKNLNEDEETKFKALYYDGMKQKILGNYDDAMSFFKRCLVINPASAASNYEMADIMEFKKKPDSAIVFALRSIKDEPDNVWFQYQYAQCLQETGRLKEAPAVFENIIKMHPNVSEYYDKLALSQLQAGEYKEALETYNNLEKKLGEVNEDIIMSKVEIYEKIKDYSKAEEEIQKLITYDPTVPQYYDMLGNIYELEGKKDKAFDEYKKMEEIHPDDPMVHLSLVDYYREKHQDKQAFIELQKAFEQPSLDIDTKIRIIVNLTSFGNPDSVFQQAFELAQIMVKANSSEPHAHVVYAELLKEKQRLAEARDQYRIAISQDSSKFEYWSSLLDLESKMNDNPDLALESKSAIGLFPTNPVFYLYNGVANTLLKKYEDAVTSLNEGVEFVLADSAVLLEFYSRLGDANYYAGHYSASFSDYELALKLNPNNDNVLNNYSYYLSVRDTNLGRAEEMSKKSNELVPNNYTYEDTYSWIFYVEGKYKDAKDWEDKALSHGGDNDGTILEHYGDILYKSGETDKAVEYWMKAKDKGNNSDLLDRKIRDKKLYDK